MTFLVAIDDNVLKALNSILFNKSKTFTKAMKPIFDKARNFDKVSVTVFDKLGFETISSKNLYYSNFSMSWAMLLTFSLFVASITIALKCAIGTESPNQYFDVYKGFCVIGGLVLLTFCFCAVQILIIGSQTTTSMMNSSSVLRIIQLGAATLWTYVLTYKFIFFGLLIWASDTARHQQCNFEKDVCENGNQIMRSDFRKQFYHLSQSELEYLLGGSIVPLEMHVYNNMTVLMYVCFAVHVFLVYKEQIPFTKHCMSKQTKIEL